MDFTSILFMALISVGVYFWFKNKARTSAAVITPAQEIKNNNNNSIVTTPLNTAPSSSEVKQEIPEDSVLRRHFLAHQEAERLAMSNPAVRNAVPSQTESIKVSADKAASTDSQDFIPEDSVLRRHYLSTLAANAQ